MLRQSAQTANCESDSDCRSYPSWRRPCGKDVKPPAAGKCAETSRGRGHVEVRFCWWSRRCSGSCGVRRRTYIVRGSRRVVEKFGSCLLAGRRGWCWREGERVEFPRCCRRNNSGNPIVQSSVVEISHVINC